MKDAPYFAEVAEGPDDGRAVWTKAEDDVTLRIALWNATGGRGTILLFPGRTECIEKYGRTAKALALRDFAVLAIDWRGQGLSDRMIWPKSLGHVSHFTDYQRDVAAMLRTARKLGVPEPYFLLAHSMGGLIGLRALMEDLPVQTVAFSAPMWGIGMNTLTRPVAHGVVALSRQFGVGQSRTPGQSLESTLHTARFVANQITSDREMFNYIRRQVTTHPELGLGGPTIHWLGEALRESRELGAMSSPDYRSVCFLGLEETVVDPRSIKKRMARWHQGELVTIPGARHEVLMETPAIRARVIDRVVREYELTPT